MNRILSTILLLLPFLGFSQLTIGPGAQVRSGGLIATGGNVINASDRVVFDSGAELLLNGTDDQGINALTGLTLSNLSIAGGSTKAIFGSVQVSGMLDLVNGFVSVSGEIDENNLILLNGAQVETDGNSWVSGALIRQGTGGLDFPLGAGGRYAPVFLDVSGTAETITGAIALRNDGIFALRDRPTGIDSVSQSWLWAVFSDNLTSVGTTLPILSEDAGLLDGRDDLLHVVIEADTTASTSVNLGGTTTSVAGLDGVSGRERTANSNPGGNFARVYLVGTELTTVPVIHNIMTPNGDGFNDYLRIDAIGIYGDDNEVIILDRWGAEVYRKQNFTNFDDVENPYDGSFDFLTPGNYICILKYAGQTAKQVITVLN